MTIGTISRTYSVTEGDTPSNDYGECRAPGCGKQFGPGDTVYIVENCYRCQECYEKEFLLADKDLIFAYPELDKALKKYSKALERLNSYVYARREQL